MWSGQAPPPPAPGMYGAPPQQQQMQALAANKQKNDIFVGNLAFGTTEEQLHQAFSEIGRVLNVRLVTDAETGKSRGFSFIEFEDPQAALSAIRNMNDYELNGRRLRVNFSSSSHLEALAGKLGMDLPQRSGGGGASATTPGQAAVGTPAAPATSTGTTAVADALKGMSKAEMYDVVAKLKEIADRDPDEARRVISGHPQLPEALLYFMSKLDMVKTPVPGVAPPAMPAAPVRAADPRAAVRSDPRQAAASTTTATAAPAPAVRADPRQRADPRARAAAAPAAVPPPPPPPPPPAYGAPPPPPPNVAHLDPQLVQQVMSLTPQQIQQLPPDKQQSILQLRQQITGSNM